jgi:putative ABC transport system permease protein
LVVAEVALALMLLVGAGLLLHSFFRVLSQPPGFDPQHAVAMQLSLPRQSYPYNAERSAFQLRLLEKVEALPGVEAAGMASALSMRGTTPDRFFQVAGRANQPESGYDADDVYCTPGFFRAMGIPLQRGRFFEPRDAAGPRVAIISETMARAYFPGEDPLGRSIRDGNEDWEIVGIVGDLRARGLAQQFRPTLYRPQSPREASQDPHLVVRTRVATTAAVAGVKQALHELDPTLPLADVKTLQEMVDASLGERRLTLVLLALFAGAALLLAAIGLYGVVAYAVTQRTAELGIRLALGATPRDVVKLILRQAMTLVGLGLALGLIGAVSLSGLLTTLLYDVKPTDPSTFAGVSVGLLGVALFASFWPARRASKVDPMVALRSE